MRDAFLSVLTVVAATVFPACKATRSNQVNEAADSSAASLPAEITAKLQQQWARYTPAREAAFAANSGGKMVTRGDWDRLLAIEQPLTEAEIHTLKSYQTDVIAQAKVKAQSQSVIDLDGVRSQKRAADLCQKIPPGAMLHLHPGGMYDETIVKALLDKADPVVDPERLKSGLSRPTSLVPAAELAFLDTLKAPTRYSDMEPAMQQSLFALFFLPAGPQDFSRFQAVFAALGVLGSSKDVDTFKSGFQMVADKMAMRGFLYGEFTTRVGSTPNAIAYHEEVVADVERLSGLRIGLKTSFDRAKSGPSNLGYAKNQIALPASAHLVGFDIIDDEHDTPLLDHAQGVFAVYYGGGPGKARPLHLYAHAGEHGLAQNVRDAVILGAERVGHGVQLINDPVTLAYAAKVHYPIDVNLWSNVRLRAVQSVEEHPFLQYLRLGLAVSLSTDDEGILQSDWSKECQMAVEKTDITYAELRTMIENSLVNAFIAAPLKQELRSNLQQQLKAFEASWH